MLAIRIDYLTGLSMATRHDDPSRSKPEWPPHPDRLYSALVAAAADISDNRLPDTEPGMALKWLSSLGAPTMSFSAAPVRSTPDVHLPSNPHPDELPSNLSSDESRKLIRSLLPVLRKKAALPMPAVVPDDPVVFFIWPDADAGEYLQALRAICHRVTRLGRSRSLVRALIVDDPPAPTHVPDDFGELQLRVPGSGRLEYLVDKNERDGGKPAPCPVRRYRRIGTEQVSEAISTSFDRCWILGPSLGDPPLPAVSLTRATQAFRKALIECIATEQRIRGVETRVPDCVHGHGQHPHCGYIALPFVHPTQRYAEGSVKGLALLLPKGTDHQELTEIARGLVLLGRNGLGIPGVGTWRLKEAPADAPPSETLARETWTRPSSVWATATPMVFGHYPKPNKGGEVKVVLDSLLTTGISPEHVLEIAIGRHSPLHGALPSWHFRPQKRGEESGRRPMWLRHVTLVFDRPVRGPLVLGSMRYFGLGLMRPIGS